MTTANWMHQLARCLARPDSTPAVLESHLDDVLLWLSNPDHPRACRLERAIARVGLTRSEAATRAYTRLDHWLFDAPGSAARTLGLAEDAHPALAKQRYRRLVQVYHPDRHPDRTAWATQRTERLNRAFDAFRHTAVNTPADRGSAGRDQAAWRRQRDRLIAGATATADRIRRWFAGQTPTRRWTTLALLAIGSLGLAIAISTAGQPRRPQILRPPGVPSIQSLPSLGRSAPATRADEPVQPARPEPAVSALTGTSGKTETAQTPASETANLDRGPVVPQPPPAMSSEQPVERPATTGREQTPAAEARADLPARQTIEQRPPEPQPQRPPPPARPADEMAASSPALTIPSASPPMQPAAPRAPTPPTRLAQGPIAPPVIPGVGATRIDCRPVAERLGLFQQAYASGALDQLMALYSPLARENALASWFAIRQTYADWFAKTARRHIDFGQLQVKPTANGERCAASAAFRVEYLDGQSSVVTKDGVIQILFERRGQDLLILRARY